MLRLMRLPLMSICRAGTLLLLLGAGAATAAPGDATAIRLDGDSWGDAGARQTVATVLRAVATVLAGDTRNGVAPNIAVAHAVRGPLVLYERGDSDEYIVLLRAGAGNWHLYVYEFAHEFCHIISNYDKHPANEVRHNQWFEEALCEAASLFALRTLADRWQTAPPTPQLAEAAPHLRRFYELLMAEDHRRPAAASIAGWVAEREDELRRDPYIRTYNELVATQLLPLFVADPTQWAALRSLNLAPDDRDCRLDEYLDHWYRNARTEHKAIVVAIRDALLAPPPTRLASGTQQ